MAFDPDDVSAKNEESLRMLARSLRLSQGQFSLILARCNYTSLRQRLLQQLRERSPIEFQEQVVDPSAKTLETTIQGELEDVPNAIIISGLESVRGLDALLIATNQARDEFRKNFPFPLVLWGTDEVLRRLIRVAPDFESWAATPIEFEIATDELIQLLQQTTDQVFAKVLEVGASIFIDNAALNLGTGSPLRVELEAARYDLQSRGVKLDPELEASLEFVLGRDIDQAVEESRQHLERSLALWQTSSNWERRGCVLYSLGLWWRIYVTRHRDQSEQACRQEKDCFGQCIEAFEQANRTDLVAKFINPLGAILQELQQWDELEVVASKALSLHQTYPDPFRLARVYGFLAEVELSKSAWIEAKELAEQALATLKNAEIAAANSVSSEANANLEWVRSYHQGWHQGWYLFSLARSLAALDQAQQAIAILETATVQTKPYYDPELYIRILETLRSLYFEQGYYLKAFEIKQDQRSIEQQYGFRAFVGAGRLQPKQQVINPVLTSVEAQGTTTQEITASGRQQDVNRLIERIGRNDHKLTVIQGQSGVGKSSILQAGLIPALKQKAIGTRKVVPVLQQVYPDWLRVLGQCLAEAMVAIDLTPQPPSLVWKGEPDCMPDQESSSPLLVAGAQVRKGQGERSIHEQLQENADNNLLTVLIFDQFEEFFFVCKEPSQRRPFYEFMRECLDIPYVKVILSLREDYIYYLLECNDRLINLDVINNNILDKNILCYLGNFSEKDAKTIIQSLTEQTQYPLEPSLIDALVQDLAGELGEVRPIEMQVVGAQLQTEKITKLEQYQKHGPKEKLVGRFLEEVVKDCGSGNEQIAKLVLYLLTDENNTRPLKTRSDLELELDVPAEKLDLVLEIFVKSRLVFQVPALPVDCYQLVHDYLVAFVRQQQSSGIIAELDKEREQRKLTEAKLNQVLKKQLRTARRAGITLAALLSLIGGFSVLAAIAALNGYIAVLSYSTQEKQGIERLVLNLKAGKQLKYSLGAIADTRLLTMLRLQRAVENEKEFNRLEGHTDKVTSLNFSRDNKMLASGSKDKTISLWSVDGKRITILRGHSASVTSISFSHDGKMLASGSEDNTVRLWRTDGTKKEIAILQGHRGGVTSISFSSDSQIIASASNDKTVKLWHIDGREIKTLSGHSNRVIGVSFSSDGKTLVSVGNDNTGKIWTRNGTFLQNIKDSDLRDKGYNISNHTENEEVSTISSDGKIEASASEDKTVKLFSRISKAFKLPKGNVDTSTNVSFSPDSQTITSIGTDKSVKLWSSNGTLLKTLTGVHGSASFSANSQLIATASANDVLNLWSINSRESQILKGHSQQVTNISFSPDSQTLASSSSDGTVKLWRNDGKLLTTLKGYSDSVKQVNFSPDGKLLVSIGDSNTVKLWRNDGKLLTTLKGYSDSVEQVNFSPDGKLLVSIGDSNTVKLWHNDGKLLTTLKGYSDSVEQVNFSPDSQILISVGTSRFEEGKIVEFWGLDGRLIKTISTFEDDNPIFSSNFRSFATISRRNNRRNNIKLWSLDSNQPVLIKGYDDQTNDVSFSPDGNIIALGGSDKVIKLFSLNGSLLKTLNGHNGSVNGVSFSPDGKIIASIGGDGTTRLWSRDGILLKTLDWHTNGRGVVSFSSDGQIIKYVYVSDLSRQDKRRNYTVKLWRRDGTLLKTIEGQSNYSSFDNVQLSPDGKTVVFISSNNTVKLWQRDGTLLKTLEGHSDAVNSISFSPDGETIASASNDKTIKLWQRDGTLLKTLEGHSDAVNSISFSPDGETIASASNDKTIKLWQRDGTLLKTLEGHSDVVNSVSFSPDGKTIASASNDKTLKLWQRDGTLIKSLQSYSTKSLSFSPDSSLLASAGGGGSEFWILEGMFLKNTSLIILSGVESVSFSPDNSSFALANKKTGTAVLSMNLDELLGRGCNQVRDYLKNNPNVAESDRHLCDGL